MLCLGYSKHGQRPMSQQLQQRSPPEERTLTRMQGVEPTLWVARAINPEVTRAEVKRVVRECVPCGEYDPHPIKMQKGSLKVEQVWDRLACERDACRAGEVRDHPGLWPQPFCGVAKGEPRGRDGGGGMPP